MDEYDFVEQVESASKQDIRPVVEKTKPVILIMIGMICEILAICFSYVIQHYDMELNGSCYTEALVYLKHLPLALIVIVGFICITVGSYKTVKK